MCVCVRACEHVWPCGCTSSRYDAGRTACWLIGAIGTHLVDPVIFPPEIPKDQFSFNLSADYGFPELSDMVLFKST